MTDLTSLTDTVTTRIHALTTPAIDRNGSIELKQILVPIDFSRESLRVLEYSIGLSRTFGAALHVLHVRPAKEATAIERAGNLMLNYDDALAFLQDRLADLERRHGMEFAPENCHVFGGRPFEEICKVARQIDADLIALGTRGQSGLRRVLLGSTAERVIRYAPCPVLIPRGKSYKATAAGVEEAAFSVRDILVPVDFSECSIAGVKYAVYLAQHFNAKLHLLHAIYPHPDLVPQDRVSANLLTVVQEAQMSAEKDMKEFKRVHVPAGISCAIEIRTGYPVDEICAEAGESENDLVVISTHGHSGLRHTLIGSVAEHVARYAECPVLVVPSRKRT